MEISYHVAFFVPTNTTTYKTWFYYKRDSPPKTIYLLMKKYDYVCLWSEKTKLNK